MMLVGGINPPFRKVRLPVPLRFVVDLGKFPAQTTLQGSASAELPAMNAQAEPVARSLASEQDTMAVIGGI